MTDKVYIGDTGTAVELDTGVDLSGATVTEIAVQKPDGSAATWAASVTGSTKLRYVSLAATFDQAGTWRVQAKVTLPSGAWRGETAEFKVYKPFG